MTDILDQERAMRRSMYRRAAVRNPRRRKLDPDAVQHHLKNNKSLGHTKPSLAPIVMRVPSWDVRGGRIVKS